MMSVDILRTLVGYKAWGNKGLFTTLLSHPKIESIKDTKSIVSTLNHAYVVDLIFQAHLTGTTHKFSGVNTVEQPSVQDLWNNVQTTDQWYINYVDSVTVSSLSDRVNFKFTSGEEATMLRSEMILHVVNHGTYHRGNVGVLLLQNGINPDKDVVTDFLSNRNIQSHFISQ